MASDDNIILSERFRDSFARVVVCSADNVHFRLDEDNLKFNTGAFPFPNPRTNPNTVVHLPESAATLEILFQYIYPFRYSLALPEDLDFDTFISLADAAEKYEIVGLIYACELMFNNNFMLLYDHPMEMLKFAVKHDNQKLVKRIKDTVLESSGSWQTSTILPELAKILSNEEYKSWSIQREQKLVNRIEEDQSHHRHGIIQEPRFRFSLW
ncbi:hypothetical protein FB446DRAFT_748418 [Lentinula raphanica]|nr:hypothetical protein FB446DRAFT_748418 [Lentinula raphanica]